MIATIEKLGDRLLSVFVPSINAEAGAAGISTVVFCYCLNCRSRYKNCNGGVCGGCNLLDDCCSPGRTCPGCG